jgi:Wax ester synthase-like Acyl-CoA acyltransferase domain
MPSTMDRMSTLDAEFFYAEHDNVPMHIGSVAVFDGPAPSREDLMRLFEAKLPRVPRYRQVVRATPFQVLRPVWADDQHFAIRHHVRHATIAAPGGPEQLRASAAKLFALRLRGHRGRRLRRGPGRLHGGDPARPGRAQRTGRPLAGIRARSGRLRGAASSGEPSG